MYYSNRKSTGLPKAGHRHVWALAHRGWDKGAAPTATGRGGVLLPILLLIALAVAAIGLSPSTAAMCAKLDDFPCGP